MILSCSLAAKVRTTCEECRRWRRVAREGVWGCVERAGSSKEDVMVVVVQVIAGIVIADFASLMGLLRQNRVLLNGSKQVGRQLYA